MQSWDSEALEMGSWVEEGPLCSRAAPGSCCPALPPAWHEWMAPAHSLGQQQLCILIPLNHYSDLSYYSFVFLKGQCPGTFLLFALYFACKSLLESWLSCFPLLRVLSCLAESFLPTSSMREGVCVSGDGGGDAGWFPICRECGTSFFSFNVTDL